MKNSRKPRAILARIAPLALTVAGLTVGCVTGYVGAVYLAESSLDDYSAVVTQQQDEASGEAMRVLASIKASTHPFCSDAELAYFRELVFRSTYLKDAGRFRAGKIECSATADRPAHAEGQVAAGNSQQDGTVAYSNLLPIRDPGMKRSGLQLGNAYVIFAPQPPVSFGHFPMQLTFTLNPRAGLEAVSTAAAPAKNPQPSGPDLTVERTFQQGETLYATRCSSGSFRCITATASVREALQGEVGVFVGGTMVGGIAGGVLGLLLSYAFSRSLGMEHQLRRAIANDSLEVAYQPIVSMHNERIVSAEALARWVDEEGMPVSPDVFIRLAEAQGFVTSITKVIIRRALREFGETLRSRGDFLLSVNVTAHDLCDPGFLPMLDDAVRHAKISPKSLAIEITESSAANRPEALDTIRELRWRGHSIHIDDFGTGYSNLSYLLYLNVDTIKVDKAFTRAIGTESVTVAILPQILAMAAALKMGVVAEGVETVHQADYFASASPDIHGQGWLFGRPVPAEEFHRLLEEQGRKTRSSAASQAATGSKPELVQKPQRITA